MQLEELHRKLAGRDQEAMRAIAKRVASLGDGAPVPKSDASIGPARAPDLDDGRATNSQSTLSPYLRDPSLATSTPASERAASPDAQARPPASGPFDTSGVTAADSTAVMRQSNSPMAGSIPGPADAAGVISGERASRTEASQTHGTPQLLQFEGLLLDRRRGTAQEPDILSLAVRAKELLQAEGLWPKA